jgi:uncharacterized protein YifE (UPF0438 family)
LDYNEKELVEEFYAWMVALAEHIIPPITSDQEHFVEAAAGQTEPSTWFEEVFLKVRLLQIEVFEEARRELLNPSPEIVDTDEAIQKPVRTNEGYNRPCVCRGTNYDCIYCGGTGWRD